MRWMIVLLSLIGLTAAGTVQAELSVGLTEGLTLTHDSVVRTYDVMRPKGIGGATSAPLVVDLHGFGSDSLEQRVISGFSGLSALEGFVVAWPNGIDSSWNGITCCGTGVSANVDDVGFIRAMVADIVLEVNIDVRRIYVTGLSNGGAMSHRLACEAADLFAAAAPMAYPIPYPDFSAQCNPSRLIPVLTFMGLTDTVVSYAGAAPTLVGWRDKDGCDSGGAVVEINEIYGGSDCAIDTSCAEPDLEKVTAAQQKTHDKAAAKCSEEPGFGPTDPNTVNRVAVEKELAVLFEIFGSDLDVAIPGTGTKAETKCQATAMKQAKKCQDTKLKLFNKCKKSGLKGKADPLKVPDPNAVPFDEPADLAACMGFDPKGEIAKVCGTKLESKVSKACSGQDLATLFPGDCAASGTTSELAMCIDERVECQVCLALNVADGLNRDCDDFDDGMDNGSCP